MKKHILILSIASALMLTACSSNQAEDNIPPREIPQQGAQTAEVSSGISSENIESSESSESGGAESAEAPQLTDEDLNDFLGLDGEPILAADIDEFNKNADGKVLNCTTEKICFLTKSSEICLNSRDHAERFDSETLIFADVPEVIPKEYDRYRVGDTVDGLTVTAAHTVIYPFGVYVSSADFEGSYTMSGYITVVPEDDYWINEGDILFVPFQDSNRLPVIQYMYSDGKPSNRLRTFGENDFYWTNEYPTTIIGNIHETEVDLTGIPADYSYSTKAAVTVENIHMQYSDDFANYIQCKLVGIELL